MVIMKYIFFGTPRFAAIILDQLIKAGLPPTLVVTNPDRPAGRKKILTPPPTKSIAAGHNIPVYQPEKLEVKSWKLEVSKLNGIEFAVVAAYNKILKKEVLESLPAGFIGIHPSLLPRYRGASPIQSAMLAGEKETGISLYLLDNEVDHGSILAQKNLPIAPEDDYLSLEEKLADLGAKALISILPNLPQIATEAAPQDHSLTTFTKKFVATDGFVDLAHDTPEMIYRKIKALNPEPGVYAIINEVRVKLLSAKLENQELIITRLQYAGKKPIAVKQSIANLF